MLFKVSLSSNPRLLKEAEHFGESFHISLHSLLHIYFNLHLGEKACGTRTCSGRGEVDGVQSCLNSDSDFVNLCFSWSSCLCDFFQALNGS